ncbi:MAG: acetolactate synthase small subunit [Firmicutes bacterium]|nr:acetolactate synthase small subunit [Bacillota bacterium]MCD7782468.1 acetolactate synthase small subunit [Bacillota bacterium]MCD7788001.1 acetolactate synthase small subunit [Bacillota bacterium]MCD7831742.1 acetolactate synthase small subunit [Bacillota bacterium]
MENSSRFVIAVYVENKFGVLSRVTSMFTRRGFNIDSLTVGVTETPEYSRITITMSGDGYAREQMLNQLRKLFNVKKVEYLEDSKALKRELMLVKVKNDLDNHQRLLAAIDIFKAEIIDYSVDSLCIEVTGTSEKLDAFIEMVRELGIIELCRTGVVALQKGSSTMLSGMETE